MILKRDGLIPARQITMAQAAPRLEKIIRDRKMRQVATEIFQELQKKSRVQNVYNDPQLRQQVGEGVVALVNGAPIYLRQLDEECIVRHGADVLQGLIGRRMLELDCKQNQVTVSEQEIDAEIARAAAQVTKPLPDGSPDVKGWLALACQAARRFHRDLPPRSGLARRGPEEAGRGQDRRDRRGPEEGL